MNFLLTNSEINNNHFQYTLKSNDMFFFSEQKIDFIKLKNKNSLILGNLYGFIENNLLSKINKKIEVIKSLIQNNSHKELEGRFCLINFNKIKTEIHLDKFSRFDLFYGKKKDIFYISNNFNLIVKLINPKSFDQIAIGHSLNVIGIRPPKKNTFFHEIKRVGVDEFISIKKDKLHVNTIKFFPQQVEQYDDKKIKEYYEINKNYIENTGNKKIKNIFMSSGFDSSYLAANMCSINGNKNTFGYTVIQKFSARSKIYNIFELERIKKLKEHFNIKIFTTEVDLVNNFAKYSEEISETCSQNMITNTIASFMHHRLAKLVRTIDLSSDVYAGEISDGVHNFGFSQFYSLINHESNGFREYSDKKINYLYSPSFFKKILDKTYKNDFIFREISKYKNIKIINEKKLNNTKNIFYELCDNLFNSNNRLPLNNENNIIFKNNFKDILKSYLKKEYFSKINISNNQQIYSSYIRLYNSFHWQASTISTMYNFSDKNKLTMYLPYWNPILHDYLSKMPENWGRGLEMNNIKYPLKESFRRYFKYPSVLEKGHHSYLYDIKKYSDPILEIIINIKTKKYIEKILRKYHPNDFLDKNSFDRNKIYKIINNYKKNKEVEKNSNIIFRLYCFSKMLYDIRY
jgi:hypothetical protein